MKYILVVLLRKYILIPLIFAYQFAIAQSDYHEKLEWGNDKYINGAKYSWFEGAVVDELNGLPVFFSRYKLPSNTDSVSVSIFNEKYVEYEGETDISKVSASSIYNVRVITERKQLFAGLKVFPYRINKMSGKAEKLVSFSVRIIPIQNKKVKSDKSWEFASNSVLRSGKWYKIGIIETGIYKITYEDFQALGISVNSIDPRNIRIYGQGGELLPENNSVFRFDDLQENAIYVSGESDGSFDAGEYVLFYARGTTSWEYNSAYKRYIHTLNKYSAYGYYFINTDIGQGKRVEIVTSSSLSPDYYVSTFEDYRSYENDSLNLIKSGREFYGEVFDSRTSYQFSYNFPDINTVVPVKLRTGLIGRSLYSNYFNIYINGVKIYTSVVSPVSLDMTAIYANYGSVDTGNFISSGAINITIEYNKNNNPGAIGWLDYIELIASRNLIFSGGQMAFRNISSVGKGVTEFTVGDASSGVVIWNVTDPYNVKKISGTTSGNDLKFKIVTDSLLEFVAFDGTLYNSVARIGLIDNQNIHGLGQTDMVIVSHTAFISEANRLASFHRSNDGLEVVVVTPEMVYNEFSSGMQDPTAIRAFMKMFYDRAGSDTSSMPLYLLLFGDGSYDNMNRLAENTAFVVTYQTANSLAPTSSFVTDDYFGYLDDNESGAYGGNLDIGIGRFPVTSQDEAYSCVQKILRYASPVDLISDGSSCQGSSSTVSNFADWRNVLCFIADDADVFGENFLGESEYISNTVSSTFKNYNIDKIYLDAYTQYSTPGGQRYPDVNEAITNRVEKGALLMNYIGHGGEIGWAHESILTVSQINKWNNYYNMPLFITATCEFSRFDDPARVSAGEYVFLNPDGGGIALLTTTRLAFSGSNAELNYRYNMNLFSKVNGEYPALGDVMRKSKNSYGCPSVVANFVLLGDPALKLSYPRYGVQTSEIKNLTSESDTIKAMSKVSVSGWITDENGNKMSQYTGILYPIVYDKKATITSNGNDAGSPQDFILQKNIIYKGKASIVGGNFSYTFYVPRDISYNFDKGRLSYYAQNETGDAAGYYEDFIIGGTESVEITDKTGPEIKLYLNDEYFVSGGICDENPLLYAKISDSSGVNTVGNGIGHDIAAVLDEATEDTYILNDYYESDMNTYASGVVRYRFNDISEGEHILKLKAWDIFNNSSEETIDFIVSEAANLAIDHILNYPNPFTTYTEFWFEHNQPCCGLDVQIQIFTISGKLVKTIAEYVQTDGYRIDPISWDGRDDYGDNIGRGVYLYKIRVKNAQGQYVEKIEKLVILR